MDEKARENLNKKLVKTLMHLEEVREQKRAANASFKEEIKGALARIDALSESLDKNMVEPLVGVFFDDEIKMMVGK